jgi:hypothetical protein
MPFPAVLRWAIAATSTSTPRSPDGTTVNVRYTAVRDTETAADSVLARTARLRDFFQTTIVPMVLTDEQRPVALARKGARPRSRRARTLAQATAIAVRDGHIQT